MRELDTVIDEILLFVPSELHEPIRAQRLDRLRARLLDVKVSFWYAAPEMHVFWWKEMVSILNEEIGVPMESWHRDIAALCSVEREGATMNDMPNEGTVL